MRIVTSCLLGLLGLTTLASAQGPVTALAFDPSGKRLVVGSQYRLTVYTWPDLKRDLTIKSDLSHIHTLQFAPHGNSLAVGGGRPSQLGQLQVLSWPTGKRIAESTAHEGVVYDCTWTGKDTLATASADTTLGVWKLAGDGLVGRLRFEEHSRRVKSVVALPEHLLVSAGVDHSLRVWDTKANRLVRTLDNHTDKVHALAVRPGDHGLPQVASCGGDRTVRLWQPTIGRLMRFARLEAEPATIAWSAGGEFLAAACVDGHLRLIDPTTVAVIGNTPLSKGWLHEVATGPGDFEFAVGLDGGKVVRLQVSKQTLAQLSE